MKKTIKKVAVVNSLIIIALTIVGCNYTSEDTAASKKQNEVKIENTIAGESESTEAATKKDDAESTEATTKKDDADSALESAPDRTSKDDVVLDFDMGNLDGIVEAATKEVDARVEYLNEEWESIKEDVTSYDSFVNNEDKIEGFYEDILAKHSELCTIGYKTALAYAEAINESEKDSSEKYDMSKDIDNDIYDDLFDDINDAIYEDLFDDINDYFYDGILKDSDEAGVDYSDWYDTKSDEYSRWYDTKSDVYSEWYDSKSDIYDFYYDLAGEFYSDDQERVDKVIDKFQARIEKKR